MCEHAFVCACVYINAYICACVCVCVCVCMSVVCALVCMNIRAWICACAYVCLCVQLCVCVCITYIFITIFSYFNSACQGPLYLDLLGTCHQETMKPAVLLSKHIKRYHTHVARGFSFYPPEVCTVAQGLPWLGLLSRTKHT